MVELSFTKNSKDNTEIANDKHIPVPKIFDNPFTLNSETCQSLAFPSKVVQDAVLDNILNDIFKDDAAAYVHPAPFEPIRVASSFDINSHIPLPPPRLFQRKCSNPERRRLSYEIL